jgi:hypothetical protein
MDIILWREEQRRKIGVPSKASHLQGVHKYQCYECEKIFYYRHGDPQSPQYRTLSNKPDKEGFITGIPLCHKCFHKLPPARLSRDPGCWLCSIKQADQERIDRKLRHKKSSEKSSEFDGGEYIRAQPVPEEGQRNGIYRDNDLPKRRRSSKNKAYRRSRV